MSTSITTLQHQADQHCISAGANASEGTGDAGVSTHKYNKSNNSNVYNGNDSGEYNHYKLQIDSPESGATNLDYISYNLNGTDRTEESLYDIFMARNAERRHLYLTACFISLASIAGAFLRIVIAQLFGEECANPGTVGWLAAAAPLCVTKDGQTVQEGGIVFADLPSNLLGSFIMGFLQDHVILHLAVPMAFAWLSPQHPLQHMTDLHVALKTGFCGSLTTFSSWNTEMVVIMFGTNNTKATGFFSALFGYIIGMETASGSFACGKSLARRLHRFVNPLLAKEGKAARTRRLEGVYVHKSLPDFERRFLPELDMGDNQHLWPLQHIEYLERWRATTKDARRVNHSLLSQLIEIEEAMLLHNLPAPVDAMSVAKVHGWDVDALKQWVQLRDSSLMYLPSISSRMTPSRENNGSIDGSIKDDYVWHTLTFAIIALGCVYCMLIALLAVLNSDDSINKTYRTMAYACVFAPFGALLRWHLSGWNGKVSIKKYEWFPLGTFSANMLGSMISIFAVALEYRLEWHYGNPGFWKVGTIRAIKVGFAGSLTTVSTFVAEINGFMDSKTDHAYPYIFITLLSACIIGSTIYSWIFLL